MSIHIIEMERQRFACGLFWQSLSRRHELAKEATELAAKLNFDLMVLRIDRTVAAAGFGSSREGAQPGVASLGVIVARTVAQQGAFYEGRQQPAPNWLGAFALPDSRWAYFAVRDGAFLPNGDWIGTKEEVLDRLYADYGLGGWNAVIGDAEIEAMGFHNFYPRRIEDMLWRRQGRLHVPRWMRLRSVNARANWRVLAIAASLGIAIAGGGLWYRHHQQVLNEEHERALALVRAQIFRHRAADDAALHPWKRLPEPEQFVRTCMRHFNLLGPGGWSLDHFLCEPNGVDYRWSRNGSTAALLLARVPQAQLDANGDRASLVQHLEMGTSPDEALESAQTLRARLVSQFQTLDVPLSLIAASHASVPGAAPPDGKTAPEWHEWRLRASLGELAPDQLPAIMNEPGVRLVNITYEAGAWSAEGVVYAK